MQYRRIEQHGGTYFFTVNLQERSRRLLTEHIALLRESVAIVKVRHPFEIIAWVVLPDHMHAIWTLQDGDTDYATRWMLIKARFSRHVPAGEWINRSRRSKGERGIWQRRYWAHLITDDDDLHRHIDYVHFNPVKHGHAQRAVDWPYSSIHRYIRDGVLSGDWAAEPGDGIEAGEGV